MPTHYAGTPEEILALDTFIKLSRASESVDTRLMRPCSLEDLTPTQFGVMEALLHLGPLSQTELGSKLLKSGGNITLVIDNLQKHGFVERKRCSTDRRLIYVNLTESGHEKIARIFPRQVAAIREEMSVLTTEEQRELGRLLKKLGKGEEPARPECAEVEKMLDAEMAVPVAA